MFFFILFDDLRFFLSISNTPLLQFEFSYYRGKSLIIFKIKFSMYQSEDTFILI